MRRTEGDRVYGPYNQNGRWRVIVVRRDGTRVTKKFASSAAAEKLADSLRGLTTGTTMRSAVDAYAKHMAVRGLKHGTRANAENHLRNLLQLDASGAQPISWCTRRGQLLYDESQVDAAVDTHRNALAAGKAWGAWCVKKSWLRSDPFADVEGVGRRKKGKPQLRIDEARQLQDLLLARCAPTVEPAAVAVLACLLLGPRASEVVDREVRDLDDGGRLLWIPDSKTESGKRTLEVPGLLQPLLLALTRDRIGRAPLFWDRYGERPTRWWIAYWCKRLCKLAKVPTICPQGFRGTHGSIARRGGATGELVQQQLGHASVSMTEGGAYVQRAAIQAADSHEVARRLAGGKNLGKNLESGKASGA